MRYLDRYVRIAVKNFETELARVALTDAQAKIYLDSETLTELLLRIATGDIRPPSTQFAGVRQFTPDFRLDSQSNQRLTADF